jgi:TfoX/Sxy family transcriptional regulator of competence genes
MYSKAEEFPDPEGLDSINARILFNELGLFVDERMYSLPDRELGFPMGSVR